MSVLRVDDADGSDHEGRISSALGWSRARAFAEAPWTIIKNALIGLLWHDGIMVASAIAFSGTAATMSVSM